MTDATSIPDRADAITTDWLSGALSRSFPGVDVARIEVLEEHSGTTGRIRLGVEYGSGPSGPETMFVKLPPFDESQQKLVAATDMGRREARFYAGPAHEAPLRIPEPYFAAHGEQRTEYIMVLEDLQAAGCTFTNRLGPHADDHAGKLIRALARLHAQFWDDPRFDDELSWVPLAMRGSYGAKLIDSAREQFRGEFAPVFDELCQLYSANHEAITDWWDDGERTLIHGDTHAGNQFSDGTRVGLYDWAVISCSPGIRDVAIYLGNSCPTELRRSEQERWIAEYHRVLVESGVEAPSIDVLWDRYRRCVLYAWVAAATTASMGSKWQPIEVGMLGMTRATEACADLDTLGAFRDVL